MGVDQYVCERVRINVCVCVCMSECEYMGVCQSV